MSRRFACVATALVTAAAAVVVVAVPPAFASRTASSSGTASFRGAGPGVDELQFPEIRRRVGAHGTPLELLPRGRKQGKFPKHPLAHPIVASAGLASSNPELGGSFNGLTSRDQRLANGGNQFSVEPPDQALCAANGFVLESVNTVIRVKSSTGADLTGVQDLNTFYGYPAQFNRTTGEFGPFLTDPVCLWVPAINRWVELVLTIDQIASGPQAGNFLGTNHLDLAVSNTANPTGSWTIYKIPAQNDGTEGTPDNGCPTPPPADTPGATNPRAEIGDYPHLGMDANGIYISTNGYCFFSAQYNGAQLYAIGLQQLSGATLPSSIRFENFPNTRLDGSPGFTVWPATSFPGEHATERGGTEYFLSTIAGDGSETGNPTGTAKRIGLWALTNTSSLSTASPHVRLTNRLVRSQTYTFPPRSDQKPGPTPLRDCVNDTTTPTIFGPGCWQLFFFDEPAHDEVISTPDSLDSRMQQVWYVNGRLWGAGGTGVRVGGEEKAGIAWFNVDPKINGASKVEGTVARQGYVALANHNLSMPALAMLPSGKGAIAFSILGEDFFPSAGYVRINESGNVSPVHVAAAGLGPDDGFTSYKAFVGDPPRTRWGDYGAAWTDGSDIWIASEYIGQTCTFAEYYPAPPSLAGFGSCGATRVSLTNWYTRISKLTP
jgi:hypothetical protein